MKDTFPNKEQADLIRKNSLNPFNWKVVFENSSTLEIVSKHSSQRRILYKNSIIKNKL